MRRQIAWSIGILFFSTGQIFAAERLGEVLSPSLHVHAAAGSSDGDAATLAVGHHDPTREAGTVQGIEAGLSLHLGEHVQGFTTYAFSYGSDESWEGEFEEGFLKLRDLPGDFEVRGGRMLSRFGIMNARHLHAWDTVDLPLPLGRFLGDDGLVFDGGEVTWRLPTEFTSLLVLGAGEAKGHAHTHSHDDEGHVEGGYADGRTLLTGRLMARYQPHDFRQVTVGLSAALGENSSGGDSQIIAADATFLWRENGLEPGGRSFRWDTELFVRDMEWHEEAHDHAHEEDHEDHECKGDREVQEVGFYTVGVFTPQSQIDVGLRLDYVEGIEGLEAGERFRVSPFGAWFINANRQASLRIQYNYDQLESDEAHSVWLQVGLSLGAPEVR